ncbi:GlxA family transcriptional regulator [Deminuibacter soli]|uniref:Helix-turn-helix domain-containing protein n=1 Tax=Deminuibacter soli TaxID=2291815 RepID=A0A3E1NCX9_9BACT|nr:helix-turn-helix domain-containing protein [Deminuibacter soli]RFM25628.1 helix-turn-helix domain-containing protein [Deminuibacter soli]
MKKIALLIHEDVVLSTVAGALDMLIHTNRYLQSIGKPPAFKITLAGEEQQNNLLHVATQFLEYKTLDDAADADLVVIPAFYGNPDLVFKKHNIALEWIRDMYQQGAELASLCCGSYMLAQAGLLTGKTCTSHWRDIEDLQQRYPDVNFFSHRVITDQDGIYTSGGAFSSLNLMLYIIEKVCGREMGVWASKMFSLDIDRVNQSHFAIFEGQRCHSDEEILKAQTYIEQSYHAEITVEDVAEKVNMSKRNFIRRFKKATQNTPLEYLQRVKIEAAKKALERNEQSISSLMYETGYNDVKTFRYVFKRLTGLTPQDYRRKFSREA